MTRQSGTIYEEVGTNKQAIFQFMKALILEQEALSEVLIAEADKTHAFTGPHHDFPTKPSTTEIIQFNHSATRLLDTMLMAEWLLWKKMHTFLVMNVEPERKLEDISRPEDDLFDF